MPEKKPPPAGYKSWKQYWYYRKEAAKAYGSTPEGTYTVDIPGIKDVFRYESKKSYDKEYKAEIIQRFKTKESPVPEVLQWIPDVINKIDDAQDLLYTAAVMGKFLIRRVAPRFIPYVGWALLAMDIMNIATKLLSLAMTPGLTKPNLRKGVRKYRNLKKAPLDAFRDFLAPGGWRKGMAFALQAPQAMVTLTGYGLQLGSIMGAVSETIWGGIRSLGGAKVTFRGPPPSDPASKAARYLSQHPANSNMRDILTPDEHLTLIAAQQVAVGILLDAQAFIPDNRANTLMDTEVAVYEPWELSTLEALEEADMLPEWDITPYTAIENPTYGDIVTENVNQWYDWERSMSDVMRDFGEEANSVVYQIYHESSHDMIEAATSVPFDDYTEDFSAIKAAYRLTECNFMPEYVPSEDELRRFFDLAYTLAEARGKTIPDCRDYYYAGVEIFGTMIPKPEA